MDLFLIAARAVHFAATISLAGVFVFECFIAAPVSARAGDRNAVPARLGRHLVRLAVISLALLLVSGAAWLLAIASNMSGQPLAAALLDGAWLIVLTQTRFGEAWLVRVGFAAAIAICVVIGRRRGWAVTARWAALLFALPLLAGIAWAGHGAATPGAAGDLHLAGDILHLLGAGGWLGTLLPFTLLLIEARRDGDAPSLASAGRAARRFSVLAFVSVALLLFGGFVNTWFLAGTVPALIGTGYGRLLLAKITLFLATLVIAAVNLLRLSPRVAAAGRGAGARVLVWMRRNALAEAALGLAVLAIVAALGTLPPGLHAEPGWPFPYRVEFAGLSLAVKVAFALSLAAGGAAAVATVALAAAGRYRTMAACIATGIVAAGVLWLLLRPALEPAYPTSFYAPAEPYSAPSIIAGAAVYTANCALCHGASGKGDGPAAAGLPVHPANLTEAHLLAHTPGDLFWWVGNGKGNGAMPGFAATLTPADRWDVINFVRARAAAVLSHDIDATLSGRAVAQVPDFAFEEGGTQHTLNGLLRNGPVLLILTDEAPPGGRLTALAAVGHTLTEADLTIVALETASAVDEASRPNLTAPLFATAASAIAPILASFRSPGDGGETELLLDRGGFVRARWTAVNGNLPDAARLADFAKTLARLPVAAPSHPGHSE
jgi:putative copper resistance protein D